MDLETLILIVLGLIGLVIVMEMFLRWFVMRDISDFLKATSMTTTSVITEAIKAGVHERTEALRTIVSLGTIDMVTDYISRGKVFDVWETEALARLIRKGE
jgi:hypothetical protein